MQKILVSLTIITVLSIAQAQMSSSETRRKQWIGDFGSSGVGIEFFTPKFTDQMYSENNWSGLNALFGPVTFGIAQGRITTFEPTNPFMPPEWETPAVLVENLRANRIYFGMSMPLPFLTFGKYLSYNNSFRGHPIVNATFGGYRIFEGNAQTEHKLTASFFSIAPGYRLRLPYMTLDFAINARINIFREGQYEEYQKRGFAVYPQFTIRWDGLLDRFNPTFVKVDAANWSTSNHRTETTTRTEGNYRVTRTTTSYDVNVTPTSVTVTDIGQYFGLGLKYGRNGLRTLSYMGNTNMFGAQILYRKANLLIGLNLEGGRVGHGPKLQSGTKGTLAEGNKFSRRVSRWDYQGIGSYSVFNMMLDFGVNINNLLLAAGGTSVAYNEATSFLAFNLGYSLGIGIVGGQRFVNPIQSINHYEQLNSQNQSLYNRGNTYFEDPRVARLGRVGGLFLSCDIGHASLRMQWYRYRRAPMANGLVFSFAWRIG